MSLASKIQVDLPRSGIIIRKSDKNKYVYKVLKTFRNEKGQPTNTRVSIGKLDSDSGRLIPNDNYFAHYGDDVLVASNSDNEVSGFDCVKSVGGTFLVEKISENLEVSNILTDIFGVEKANLIQIVVKHMVLNGNVFEFIENWCDEFVLDAPNLTSPSVSALFSSISYGERMEFFKQWTKLHAANDEHYAYDVTSFSTYANSIAEAEFGYNRDGEDLPQINLGSYFGQQSGLPMFYVTYSGSIVDKSHLQYMMAYNKDLGINSIKFIMDKGFCTTDNLKFMRAQEYQFLIAADNRNKTICEAIDSVRENLTSMEYRMKEGLYGTSVRGTYYSIASNLHIYYQPIVVETKRNSLERKIEKMEVALSNATKLTKKEAKPYQKLFNIQFLDNNSFSYSRNYKAIDEMSKNYGYLCLVTNFDIESSEALDIYRRKDTIEKSFDDIKNHIDMKRLKTHKTETTDGKMFCAFLALIIICSFSNSLKELSELKMSKHKAFAELAKIRLVITRDGKRLINPLTKIQRLILESCGLSADLLLKFIKA